MLCVTDSRAAPALNLVVRHKVSCSTERAQAFEDAGREVVVDLDRRETLTRAEVPLKQDRDDSRPFGTVEVWTFRSAQISAAIRPVDLSFDTV